jgi:hypothetical protein
VAERPAPTVRVMATMATTQTTNTMAAARLLITTAGTLPGPTATVAMVTTLRQMLTATMRAMLDLAKHIAETKAGHFEPAKFEDHYESALQELLEKKQKGQPIAAAKKAPPSNVYNLMDALRASIKGDQRTPAEKPAKATKKAKSAKPAAKRKAG